MTNLLIDSAVYIGLLRSGVDVRQRLLPFLSGGHLYNCGMVRAEVIRGMISPKARDGMLALSTLFQRCLPMPGSGIMSLCLAGN